MKIRQQTVEGVCFIKERQLNSLEHEDCSGSIFTRKAADVNSEACFTTLTGDCHDGPQHDRSSSDTVMISMNFDTYSSLAIFFIICFVLFLNTKLYILNECYQCLMFITVRNLQSS